MGKPSGFFVYLISGLTVWSEVALPSAIAVADGERSPDVVIRAADVPDHLPYPVRSNGNWEAQSDLFLLRLSGIARFLISQGEEILFALDPQCDVRTLALYLMGTCFAIALQQRGNLVLHASAVAAGGRAMLFCGQSGAGKSTLAALLCREGYGLLNDDVCNLAPAPGNSYEVRPDGRMLKLWSKSLDQLEWTKESGMEVRADVEKYFSPPPLTEVHARPVGAVYILREAAKDEEISIRQLRAIEGMAELKRNAYRPALVTAMALEEVYFEASAALQRTAGIYLLSRRMDFTATDSVLGLLKDHWKSLSAPVEQEMCS